MERIKQKTSRILLLLTGGGVLFSGYLSGVKFFSDVCAFGESCPYFWGYPTCYYGFAMFLILFLTTLFLTIGSIERRSGEKILLGVATLGILFAGYFTFGELPKLFTEGLRAYVLGLPTCALGLVFYLLVFTVSFRSYREAL